MRFRKRPVEVEALHFNGHNFDEIREFTGTHPLGIANRMILTFNPIGTFSHGQSDEVVAEVWDKLHATWVGVKAGQWIICGVEGEFYPVDPYVFEATYEPVPPYESEGSR